MLQSTQMQQSYSSSNLSGTTRFIIKILVIVLVGGLAATIASYAASPDMDTKRLAEGSDYWESGVESIQPEVDNPPDVPPQTLETKAAQLDTFVGVDLEAMQLYWYEGGEVQETYPVLSKGRPGSRFETPSGQYEIGYRNDRHLSSIGDVYMPYSLQFYGNFFIHGWPYYPGGEPVSDGFSGGCIRLSNEDAKEVFEKADRGTPVVVVGGTKNENSVVTPQVPAPNVSAKSYLVADIDTGHVFAAKRATEAFPIASITKLMTAVVANETIAYNDPVTVTQRAVDTYGQAGGLSAGEALRLETLYYPLLLESSNDAATAIAEHHGFDNFMKLMNRKAMALDMDSTHFRDPSGLSDGNTSSGRDVFRLVRYIHDRKDFILDLTTEVQKTTAHPGSDALRNFTNNNPMVGRDNFLGGKNGYTDNARHTLVSVFSVSVDGSEREVAIIVLGSESHVEDTVRLLSWLKRAT